MDILNLVIFAFIIAFTLALAVGANDVANSYGTSVGSGVITFRQACILATIFETSGSVLLGYKVVDTMRKGILDVTLFEGREVVLVCGMLSALIGSTIWIFIATCFRMPVSTTHSIVGSTVGFSLVVNGFNGLNLKTLGAIVLSWFVSPILSGLIGLLIFTLIKILIINAKRPLNAGLNALPFIYGLTIFVNVLGIILGGSKLLGFHNTSTLVALTISNLVMIATIIFIKLFVVPWQEQRILNLCPPPPQPQIIDLENRSDSRVSQLDLVHEPSYETVNKLFHFLQILSAVFTSFSHGGNDVSNSIGPLIAIWTIYQEGSVMQKAEAPIFLLFYGGLGMVVGLWLLGRRVNETIGTKITKITPTHGFTVETSAATTVLVASKLGIPISSTHCIVGSVVILGWVYGERDEHDRKVDWSLFRSIVYAWLITVPLAAGFSAICMAMFIGFHRI